MEVNGVEMSETVAEEAVPTSNEEGPPKNEEQMVMTPNEEENIQKKEEEPKAVEPWQSEEAAARREQRRRPKPKAPWLSLGSEKDVDDINIRPARDLIAISITRKRSEFGGQYKFADKDAQELWNSSQMECRPFKDPSFDKKRIELEVYVQSTRAKRDLGLQTSDFLLRNGVTQYAAQDLPDTEKIKIMSTEDMNAFLQVVKPRYETALQQNEVADILKDEFEDLAEEDSGLGAKSENLISESQSFTDLEHSKGKFISAIDWMPGRRGKGRGFEGGWGVSLVGGSKTTLSAVQTL
ncbi:hypothetical protein CBR_g34159 [Chara braunii]|uniref:Uncharacterized protein n=1 Tax=Chara braunii TaxID=69332 RepID=A0A388LI32_CHABU|nr:hypothetical protein CBR_g34159 [Chara braunii]|eukprot:GBG81980.1 hypothetical protein CBR_g34159 [Chara braunii]